jgi:gamma-glutamyltranspeptidase
MAYRPTLMGRRGMVATEHYLSAEAGMRILHGGIAKRCVNRVRTTLS